MIIQIAKTEYKKDAPDGVMGAAFFKQALFMLADRWTDEISVSDYSRFLKWLYAVLRANPTDDHKKQGLIKVGPYID
jgi:hypothetical protein